MVKMSISRQRVTDTLRYVLHWLPSANMSTHCLQAECPDVQLSAQRRTGLPDHHVSASFGEPQPSSSALSRAS